MKPRRPAVMSIASVVDAMGSVSLPAAEHERLADALTTPQRSVLRFRRDVDVQDFPFRLEAVPWYRLACRLCDPAIQPSRILSYACGDYFLQDAGSLLALAACDADRVLPNETTDKLLVCDLCAAPGGKASALLEMLGDDGFLLANEPIRSRVASLAYNLARTGSDRYAITSIDPEQLANRLTGVFDLVLVDAPCSGQALLARGRQTTSALTERQIMHSAARQRRILTAATRLARPGGRLIYSTCTFAEAENEQQVQFLCQHKYAQPAPIDRLREYTSGAACYRLWPHQHRCAGSFAAAMDVTIDLETSGQTKRSWKRKHAGKAPADAQRWFALDAKPVRLKSRDAVVYAWPADAPEWVDEIAAAGPELLHRTGQTWKPSHAAALRRVDRARCLQSLEVDADTAKAYLSGKPIACESDGWLVVRHGGRPLGWVKARQPVGKNQLPAAARMMGPWL